MMKSELKIFSGNGNPQLAQAICDYRRGHAIDGPLYLGKDTHALSGPAQRTALEVLAANGVATVIHLVHHLAGLPAPRGLV